MPFAVVNHVRIDDPELASQSARTTVMPRLRQLAGFESAVFLVGPDAATGFSVMVFAEEDQAEAMARRLGSGDMPPPEGVTFERQELFEVVASG